MDDQKKDFSLDDIINKYKSDDSQEEPVGQPLETDVAPMQNHADNGTSPETARYADVRTVDTQEQPLDMAAGVSLARAAAQRRRGSGTASGRRPDKRRKKRGGSLKTVIWAVVIIVVSIGIAAAVVVSLIDIMGFRFDSDASKVQWVTIEEGSSTEEIADLLAEKNIIKFPFVFRVYSKLTGADGTYNYGDYELKATMGYDGVIDMLQTAGIQADEVEVTIPEGSDVDDIMALLEKNGVCSESEFKQAMRDGAYGQRFIESIPREKVYYLLEGYLYPDTYKFYLKDEDNGVKNAERAINKMLDELDSKLTDEMYAKADAMGYSMHEILTMASIVELEASGYPDEMSKVAQVFYNRLNWDDAKFLGSTPTKEYPHGNGRYDTNADTGYEGLPPGPLCSPSMDAIRASLYPDTTVEATYFVTDAKMKFYYTNSLSEHDALVRRLKDEGNWIY